MFGKEKFVKALRAELDISVADADKTFDKFISIIIEAAETDTVRLPKIGIIRKNNIPVHEATNPSTGQVLTVPDRYNYRMSSQTRNTSGEEE